MSAPLYTHPSLRPGILVPVSSGNGDTAPVDNAEFHRRPSSSSSLSPSSSPYPPPHNGQVSNGGDTISGPHGFNQPGTYQPCACHSENLPQFVASRRLSANSNLALVREQTSERSVMHQELQRGPVSSPLNPSLTAKRTSLSNPSPRSSLQPQSQAHIQCFAQPCVNDNHIANGNSLDATRSNASSPGQLKTTAPIDLSQSLGHPAHRHSQTSAHPNHYSRKPGGPGTVTSASSPPLHHYTPRDRISSEYNPFIAPGHDPVTSAGSFSLETEHTRPPNYPTMNSDSALLKRRMNAREQLPYAKDANGSGDLQEPMTLSKENLPIPPLAANNMHARINSLSGATQNRRSSDLYSAFLDRRNSAFRMPLQSPCFFHQRFENAVNISQILNEIEADEWISHSRLVATATGVREVSRQLQRRQMKMEVKSVLIVTKARDNRLVYLTRELAEWLMSTPRYNNGSGNGLGVKVYVDAKLQKSRRFDAPGLIAKNPAFAQMLNYWTIDMCWACPEKFDLVLTLGGDGTVLFTSWLFQRVVPPVLSFSLGSLGFLTHFEFSRYKEHLNRIMGDTGMRVNLRMRFTCTVIRVDRRTGEEREDEQFEVVNELVIDRGPSPWVSNLELYADGDLLTVVQADGCIISTPTGSTAYSLSAGGSLVHPSIPAILLTPICPHTLSFRPMVLSDSVSLRIAVPAHSRSTAYCSFDGKSRTELRQGDYVTVEASQYPFPTVVSGSGEWFDSVRRALRWNTRGAVQRGWGASHNEELMAEVGDINLGPNLNSKDLEDDGDEPWDIDTDSNSDVMHYEALSSSSRRSQLVSRSGTTSNSNSTSASNTLPTGIVHNEDPNSNSVNITAASPTVINEPNSGQTHEAKLYRDNADDLLKLKTLNLADDARSGSSTSPSEGWDKVI